MLLLLTKPKLNVFFNAVAIVASIYTLLQVKLILWILLGLCPRYCEFGFLNFFPISNFSQVFCIKLRKTNSKISSHKEHIKERKQRFSLLTFLWRSLRVRQVFLDVLNQVSFKIMLCSVSALYNSVKNKLRHSSSSVNGIITQLFYNNHCVKLVQMRDLFWSVLSRTWTEYSKI